MHIDSRRWSFHDPWTSDPIIWDRYSYMPNPTSYPYIPRY